jgi:hypothetical protein
MTSEIIKWDSNRFVMREYSDTGAVYIFDKVENVGYTNQTETARICEISQSNISRYAKKTPKELEALLGGGLTLCAIEAFHGGTPYQCIKHSDLNAILHYAVVYASGKENRLQAKKNLFRFGEVGSLAYILHMTGIQLKPVFEEDLLVETIDVHDRVTLRLEATKQRKAYCEVMNQCFINSQFHWECIEGLTQQEFFAKWSNFTYNLLLGTNAQGLRKVSFCDGKLIIGRNHLAGTTLLKAVQIVEKYVTENYDSQIYNNLKKLHIEGSQIAVLTHRLLESDSYVKNTSRVRELEAWKNPDALEGSEDQNLLEGSSDNA